MILLFGFGFAYGDTALHVGIRLALYFFFFHDYYDEKVYE